MTLGPCGWSPGRSAGRRQVLALLGDKLGAALGGRGSPEPESRAGGLGSGVWEEGGRGLSREGGKRVGLVGAGHPEGPSGKRGVGRGGEWLPPPPCSQSRVQPGLLPPGSGRRTLLYRRQEEVQGAQLGSRACVQILPPPPACGMYDLGPGLWPLPARFPHLEEAGGGQSSSLLSRNLRPHPPNIPSDEPKSGRLKMSCGAWDKRY